MGPALLALISYINFGLIVAVFLPAMFLLLLVTWPFDRDRLIVGRCTRIMAQLIGIASPLWRLEVIDPQHKPKGPFVAVANHESIVDIFLVASVPWEMKWVAKASLFKVPVVGWFLKMTGDIPVDRSSRESGGEAMLKVGQYLARGVPTMFFPEGTRSITHELRPFKLGAFISAIRAGVPILPIAVHGSRLGMPKGSPWIRRTHARAQVLPPISTAGLTVEDAQALADRVRALLTHERDELIRKYYQGVPDELGEPTPLPVRPAPAEGARQEV